MKVSVKIGEDEKKFIERVSQLSGKNVYSCYQCGRCSAGCPFAFDMDILPNQIIRLVQMGLIDEAMECDAINVCASCFTCESRCPKGIDIASVAEALRQLRDPKEADYFSPEDIPDELKEELPQQALVALFRKLAK